MECYICNKKGEKTMLFDCVVREGIVHICEECSVNEGIPVIKKPTNLKLKESEKNQTVYEKLSKMAGVDPVTHRAKFQDPDKAERVRKQNEDLRRIVNEKKELNFPKLKQLEVQAKKDLVDNFHWTIFRARRERRLTQAQLAEAIGEPEASVKLVERGHLPDNYELFIRRLQTYLGVTLLKKPVREDKELGFGKVESNDLTISDLNEMKEKAEEDNSFVPYWKRKLGFLQKKREKRKETVEFSEEDMNLAQVQEVKMAEIKPVGQEGLIRKEEVVKTEMVKEVHHEEPVQEKKKETNHELSQEEIDRIIFGK